MNNTEVVIIGGGLAGLYAASRLQELKKNYLLFEANSSVGGRIQGVASTSKKDEFFDVGSSWIFPNHLRMQELAKTLELELFEQYKQGEVLYQFEHLKEPQKRNGHTGNQMLRISGGTLNLVNKLLLNLRTSNIYTNHKVIKLEPLGGAWRVTIKSNKQIHTIKCLQVLVAIPPRILARDFADESWMSPFLQQHLFACQTWMASQAKFLAIYRQPFWRQLGLSGQAFSQQGPLVEVHDGSLDGDNSFALFGFIGMPATQRIYEPAKQLKQACIRQLGVLFGQQAYKFEACHIQDWAKEQLICTGQDQSEGSRHPKIESNFLKNLFVEQNLFFAGSEYAEEEAGYLEGALVAVDSVIKLLKSK